MMYLFLILRIVVVVLSCQPDPNLTEDHDSLPIDIFRPGSVRVGDAIVIYGKGFAQVTSGNEIYPCAPAD